MTDTISPTSETSSEKIQLAQKSTDWNSLSPEVKKYLLELGEQSEIDRQNAMFIDLAEQEAWRWLLMVDKKQYEQACFQVTSIYNKDGKKVNCVNHIQNTRKNLGKVLSRTKIQTKTEPVSGKYEHQSILSFTFDTTFENQKVIENLSTTIPGAVFHFSYSIDQSSSQEQNSDMWQDLMDAILDETESN